MLCYQCKAQRPDNADPCASCGAVPDPFLGRVLQDKFEIRSRLGQGGFGAVYEAYHRELESRVAVKTLHAGLSGSGQAVERFRREALATSKLQSPNVVKVFDRGNTPDGILWLAMEFVQGETLGDRIKRQGHLTEREVIELFGPICEAMQEAHSKGIIHRDLKPENIMLTTLESGKSFPKILDFGIAALRTSDGSLTQSGTISGTPKYMAPEQWEGLKRTDARTDIYALGIIAYQCLSGELPFSADSPFGWMNLHYNKAPQPLREVMKNRALSAQAEAAIMKAISKAPDDRFATALDFYQVLSGEAPAPKPPARAPLPKPAPAFGDAHTAELVQTLQEEARRGQPSNETMSALSLQGAAVVAAPSGAMLAARPRGPAIFGAALFGVLVMLGVVGYNLIPNNAEKNLTANLPTTQKAPEASLPTSLKVKSPSEIAADFAAQEKWSAAADMEQDPTLVAQYKANAAAQLKLDVCRSNTPDAPAACQEVLDKATYEKYKREARDTLETLKALEKTRKEAQLKEIKALLSKAEANPAASNREALSKAKKEVAALASDQEFAAANDLKGLEAKIDAALKNLPPTPDELKKQILIHLQKNQMRELCTKLVEYKKIEKDAAKREALIEQIKDDPSIDTKDCKGL